MKLFAASALLLTIAATSAVAVDAPDGPPPKGTVCFARSLRDTEQIPMFCKGLGNMASVAEIYERGYRVVSTGITPEAGTGTVWLIIEKTRAVDVVANR